MPEDPPRLSTRDATAVVCAVASVALFAAGGALVSAWLALILPGAALFILALVLGAG